MGPDLPIRDGDPPARPDAPSDAVLDAAVDVAVAALHRLFLGDHSLASLLQRVVESAVETFAAVEDASATLMAPGDDPTTVATAGLMSYELDQTQYRSRGGPCLAAATRDPAEGPVLVPDTAAEPRWPAFTRHARQLGAGSVLSLPVVLTLSREERAQRRRPMRAALNLYGTRAAVFDPATVQSCQRFTAGIAVAAANMRALADTRAAVAGLRETAEARTVIEQAKGMIMARLGCSADEAFAVLSRVSQASHRKLRDLAVDVVAGRVAPD